MVAGPAAVVARDLLGWRLVSLIDGVRTSGRIVETEAYVGAHDPACHGAVGPTPRNRTMFGPPGRAYVYFIYGMHWCFNVVTGDEGDPEAVLIRALEPLEGGDAMRRRRGRPQDPANGPARLCQALGIDGTMDGHTIDRPPLYLEPPDGPVSPDQVAVSGRIGIRKARDWPLRFFLAHSPHVSSGPHVAASTETSWRP
ncbi:MAG: DNA-3-methyladenine glycosylase [Gemmatimonadales bacterium]|nr:MAG: DNA-3-methyladenine glycosylase [Gemmatimonadales bacterium]